MDAFAIDGLLGALAGSLPRSGVGVSGQLDAEFIDTQGRAFEDLRVAPQSFVNLEPP